MKIAIAAVLLAAMIPACPPTPQPPPPQNDAALPPPSADACAAGCGRLAALGCAEGAADAGCVATCNHAQSTRLTSLTPECWASATSKDDLHARCHSVRCP